MKVDRWLETIVGIFLCVAIPTACAFYVYFIVSLALAIGS